MTQIALIQAFPADPSTGTEIAVRLAGGGSRPYAQLGYIDWRGGITTNLPRFSSELGFDANGWNGNAIPQTTALRFFSSDQRLTSDLAGLYWRDARITITVGDDETGVYRTAFVGSVATVAIEQGILTLMLGDLSVDLNKPLLTDTFAGTGEIEGPVDIAGRVKRRTWGRAFDIEGQILDKANNVYEFGDPSRQWAGFVAIKDKGREGPFTVLGWQGSIDATFAALKVANAPQGGGVVAPSISCAKWWTSASGPLTADVRGEAGAGYVETAPEIVQRIVQAKTAINVVGVSAAAALRPGLAGIHVDNASDTLAQIMDKLCLGVSLLWTMTPTGSVLFRPWSRANITDAFGWISGQASASAWQSGAATASAWTPFVGKRAWTAGSATASTWNPNSRSRSWAPLTPGLVFKALAVPNRRETLAPIRTRKLGYQRNNRIHTDAEISAAIYAADALYSNGDSVDALKPATANADNSETSPTGALARETSAIAADTAIVADGTATIVGEALNPDGSIKDGKVSTSAIEQSAVQQTRVLITTADQSIAQNAIVTVASLNIVKDEAASLLKVTFSGMFWSADDLQFNCSVIVDGSVSYGTGQQSNVFDGAASAAKATISPFVYIPLSPGAHTIGFNVQNVELDNIPLIVKAGSALEVLEIKQGAQ